MINILDIAHHINFSEQPFLKLDVSVCRR